MERDQFSDQGRSNQDTPDHEFALSARARLATEAAYSRDWVSTYADYSKPRQSFDLPADDAAYSPSQGSGGDSYVKIQDPSSVSRGVSGRLRFDPEAVLESCRTLRPGRRCRSRIRHGA